MYSKIIHVKNFKTFKDETIEFDNLNILIGANASGKSNTISLFRLINNIIDYGIENAISLAGGTEYLLNTTIGKEQPFFVSFTYEMADKRNIRSIDKKKALSLVMGSFDYCFEIKPHSKGTGFSITKDSIAINYYQLTEDSTETSIKYDNEKKFTIEYKRNTKGKISCSHQSTLDVDEEILNKELVNGFIEHFLNDDRFKKELMLHYVSIFMLPNYFFRSWIGIYDFDPKLMKKAASLTSINNLEEDGSNLANILQSLLKSKPDRIKLINLLKDCLPFVKSIKTESNFDKSVSYKIQESYSKKPLYANFLSDGTVSIIAIIIALHFEETMGTVILEEPERNLHPALMDRVIEMAKESSKSKQVLITTHTPELIKHADINSILLASRCDDGFTCIKKPINDDTVKVFLENEIGIEELFAQNIL